MTRKQSLSWHPVSGHDKKTKLVLASSLVSSSILFKDGISFVDVELRVFMVRCAAVCFTSISPCCVDSRHRCLCCHSGGLSAVSLARCQKNEREPTVVNTCGEACRRQRVRRVASVASCKQRMATFVLCGGARHHLRKGKCFHCIRFLK